MPVVPLPFTYADIADFDDDMGPFAEETTSDLDNLVQDVTHILEETLGSNPDDPTRGVGLVYYLSGTVENFSTIVGVIERQLNADDRITKCDASIVQNTDDTFSLFINIQVAGTIIPLQYGWSLSGGLQRVGT